MQGKHNKELTDKARTLRKNMTREEKRLWYDFLRKYPVRFLRQKVIDNYIVDFYKRPRKISVFFRSDSAWRNRGRRFIQNNILPN